MIYMIIQAIAPILVIMTLGFAAGKTKMVNNQDVSLLNIFVMNFALPAALFSATAQTPWSGIMQQLPLIIVLVLAMWITWAGLYFLCTRQFDKKSQDAAVLTLTAALPNYAALSLPILGSLFGYTPVVLLAAAISIACGSVLLTPLCLLILEREKAREKNQHDSAVFKMLPLLIWRSVMKPIVWGPLLGVILSALGVKTPKILLIALNPLGLSASAAALFLTGVILSARQLKFNRAVIISSVAKLLIQPLIGWGIVLLMGLHGQLAVTAILMLAFSGGFFGVVFGNSYGVESPDAEATLLVTSVLCVLTVPLFISLTSWYL